MPALLDRGFPWPSASRDPARLERGRAASVLALLLLASCRPEQGPPTPGDSADAAPSGSSAPDPSTWRLRLGHDNACLLIDERVQCWGSSQSAKLGAGVGQACGEGIECLPTPTRVPAFDGVVDLALGNTQTCLRSAEGGVSCVGLHDEGQLGLGDAVTTTCTIGGYSSPDCSLEVETGEIKCEGTREVPEEHLPCVPQPTSIPGLAPAATVRASGPTCVVTEAGALWCSGGLALERFAELSERCGKYEDPCSRSFVQLSPGDVADVSFSNDGGCLLMTDGRLRCESSHLAVASQIEDALSLSVGGRHVCVVRRDHTITCAGRNSSGQLGVGSKDPATATPRVAPGLLDEATQVALGRNFSCGVRKGGELWCWGANVAGQLGQGDTEDHHAPVKVEGIPAVAQVEAGSDFVCILGTDASVWCWGSNDRGQIGVGLDQGTTCTTERLFQPIIPCVTSPVKLALADG